MSIQWLRRKHASNKIKLAVDGYIHEQQRMLKTNSFFDNVPQLINYIVTCYYNSSDSLDKKHVAKNMHIVKNCVTLKTNKPGNAFLTNVITEGKYMWTFRVKKMVFEVKFGIRNVVDGNPGSKAHFIYGFRNTDFFIAKISDDGERINNSELLKTVYGTDKVSYFLMHHDYTVKMILNMNDLTLSYIINGYDCGKLFTNVIKDNYRAEVGMLDYEKVAGCIELIDSEYC